MDELLDHVRREHDMRELREAVGFLGSVAFKAALYTVLNAAVSLVCQQQAPAVSVAQDRRGLKAFKESIYDPDLEALICAVCSCVHPHVPGQARQKIRWKKVGRSVAGNRLLFEKMLGLSKEQAEDFFWGLKHF